MLTTFIFMETEPREQCDELPCTYFVKFDLEPQYDGYWLILLYSRGTLTPFILFLSLPC